MVSWGQGKEKPGVDESQLVCWEQSEGAQVTCSSVNQHSAGPTRELIKSLAFYPISTLSKSLDFHPVKKLNTWSLEDFNL